MTWTLAFYQTPRGERPAAVFVEQLAEPARADVAALLAALRERQSSSAAALEGARRRVV